MRRPALRTASVCVATLLAAGCGAAPRVYGQPTSAASQMATAKPKALVSEGHRRPCPPSDGARTALPDVTLPCLGTGSVHLAHLRQPTVLNLWASWCRECATELPLLAAAERGLHGRVLFLGVDTADRVDNALQTLSDARVPYASVYDRAGAVQALLGLPGLPATLFVRADGTVAYTKIGAISSVAELRDLLRVHLGVSP